MLKGEKGRIRQNTSEGMRKRPDPYARMVEWKDGGQGGMSRNHLFLYREKWLNQAL